MRDLVSALEAIDASTAELVGELFDGMASAADAELVAVLRVAGALSRKADALIAAAAEQVQDRSRGARDERLTTRWGCANPADLLRRATLCDSRQAAVWLRAAQVVHRDVSITSGELLPGRFPALREALRDGAVTAAGVANATGALRDAWTRLDPTDLAAADRVLAAAARGVGIDELDRPRADGREAGAADAAVLSPMEAQELKVLGDAIAARLDQDGSEPSDERALRSRGLVFGVPGANGVVPVRGSLVADVAGQLQTLIDAVLNPHGGDRTAGVRFGAEPAVGEAAEAAVGEAAVASPDPRTRAQRQHDALAVLVQVAARAVDAPTLGGATPTLVVTMDADDYANGRWAHVDGLGAVPAAVARQVACSGHVQRVLHDPHGRIVAISTHDRVFNAAQRRAIIARDGTCVIPGCAVPARWCEIHHVGSYARGGPTSTDNGVPLCWFHHRTIDRCGWEITMDRGVPLVRSVAAWDPARRTRRASRHPGYAAPGYATTGRPGRPGTKSPMPAQILVPWRT